MILGFSGAANAVPCTENHNYVDVSTVYSTLYLCSNQKVVRQFSVALGRGGVDKRTEGDARTPIGHYRLGEPRTSDRFFIFISVGYPTADQSRMGYSGGDVGVHGPLNYLNWLDDANTWVNWTNGCIAVGTQDEINEIAGWVHALSVHLIVVR